MYCRCLFEPSCKAYKFSESGTIDNCITYSEGEDSVFTSALATVFIREGASSWKQFDECLCVRERGEKETEERKTERGLWVVTVECVCTPLCAKGRDKEGRETREKRRGEKEWQREIENQVCMFFLPTLVCALCLIPVVDRSWIFGAQNWTCVWHKFVTSQSGFVKLFVFMLYP